MKIAVLKETFPGERRVALVPAAIPPLAKAGAELLVESGAGLEAGVSDTMYLEKGAAIVPSRADAVRQADVVFQVRALGDNPQAGKADLPLVKPGQIWVGLCDPLGNPQAVQQVAPTGAIQFSLELIPRITRAQSMDVLSSMASLAGYRAVLLAAMHLPRIFPLMMTAAGTLSPARVLVIGAGVAGLQAIATAKRLGAVVHAYDVRPAVREQVESLGGKFVQLDLDTGHSEDQGGYAKAMGDDFYRKQREELGRVVADSDVVITTAAIPGKPSPLLVPEEAVARMHPGSVIVDLAAERGGNCELSQADQTVVKHGVTILGPTNLASDLPVHASQMYARNISAFLLNMVDKQKQLSIAMDDPIVAETLLTQGGQVVHPRVRELLGLPPLEKPPAAPPPLPHKVDPTSVPLKIDDH